MPSTRPERLYLEDILKAADQIIELTSLPRESLAEMRLEMVQAALLHWLAIIGEAASHLPPEFRRRHAHVDWRAMTDMRNVIMHYYFGLDWMILWRTVREDVPAVREQVALILATL